MFIEIPDKDVALKLLVESSEYIGNLRNNWATDTYNIIKEDVEFINEVYSRPSEYQVRSIDNKSLIIYGPRQDLNSLYIYELYVTDNARGQYYGKTLLNFLIKYWKKYYSSFYDLTLEVDKNNYNAINFYKYNKFEIEPVNINNKSYLMKYTG